MTKARNAVIIIVLCLIGAYAAYKSGHHSPLAMVPPGDTLHDSMAGNGIHPINASNPHLNFSNNDGDSMRDSVAGNAIPEFGTHGNHHGNTDENVPPPPRGSGDGGVGSFSGPNPHSQNPPNPLSPSGPASPSSPPQ